MRTIKYRERPVQDIGAYREPQSSRVVMLPKILKGHLFTALSAVVQAWALVVALPYPAFLDHWILHTATAILPLAATALRIAFMIRRRWHHRPHRTDRSTHRGRNHQ